jgi:hypothetical protein
MCPAGMSHNLNGESAVAGKSYLCTCSCRAVAGDFTGPMVGFEAQKDLYHQTIRLKHDDDDLLF